MNPETTTPDHPVLEDTYEAELTSRLSRELLNGRRDFSQLLMHAEGAYPTDVRTALRKLEKAGQIHLTSSGFWEQSAIAGEPVKTSAFCDRPASLSVSDLPEPHPLDFDWRFSGETLRSLCKRISARQGEPVAVLGAPTLYKYLVDSGMDAWLFDKNIHIITSLRESGYLSVIECDLFHFAEEPPRFSSALADPPWYMEHYRAFLDAASRMLLPGGQLFISVLPRLTRPSAAIDRFRILETAVELGFDLSEMNPAVLQYASPPFESEALRAESISVKDWRTGDLFTFVRRMETPRRQVLTGAKTTDRWESILLGNTTIKVRVQQASAEPFDYMGASHTGELRLRSVSRRSPARSRVNLWTSRNLALVVSNTTLVVAVLRKIEAGLSTTEALSIIGYEYQLKIADQAKLESLIHLLQRDADSK